MTTRLANDEFTLEHGGNTVTLRPSLRAAIKLERLHDGFPNLIKSITEGNLTTIREIVLAAATERKEAAAFLSRTGPLHSFLAAVTKPLFALCIAFTASPDTDSQASASTGAQTPWSKHYQHLFRIATGSLGWTPDAALSATPTEIMEAYAGLIDHLKLINGSTNTTTTDAYTSDRLQQIEADGMDPAFDRAAFHALKDKINGDFT